VTGAAPYTASNWNTVDPQVGFATGLAGDANGAMVPTEAAVFWDATNTFSSTGRGEENNNFPLDSADRKLMTGYLDQNTQFTTFITIVNIPKELAPYDVVIYTLGGMPDRGGEYTVNGGVVPGVDLKFVVASATIHGDAVFNGPKFVKAIGDDPAYGTNDWGNYVVFTNLTGNAVTITATNLFGDVPRAPVNGVQIAKSPSR
jgi:hypothetical protein